MKKRILSLALALLMLVSIVPVMASADSKPISINYTLKAGDGLCELAIKLAEQVSPELYYVEVYQRYNDKDYDIIAEITKEDGEPKIVSIADCEDPEHIKLIEQVGFSLAYDPAKEYAIFIDAGTENEMSGCKVNGKSIRYIDYENEVETDLVNLEELMFVESFCTDLGYAEDFGVYETVICLVPSETKDEPTNNVGDLGGFISTFFDSLMDIIKSLFSWLPFC